MRAVVVGAGESGAFATDTLRQRFGTGIELHVLEREDRVGGRTWRRQVPGVEVETGASLFHSSNRLLARAAEQLGLRAVPAATGWVGRDLGWRWPAPASVSTLETQAIGGTPTANLVAHDLR